MIDDSDKKVDTYFAKIYPYSIDEINDCADYIRDLFKAPIDFNIVSDLERTIKYSMTHALSLKHSAKKIYSDDILKKVQKLARNQILISPRHEIMAWRRKQI